MKTLLTLIALACMALTSCASLPSPGHWNASHTQYENEHQLLVGGQAFVLWDAGTHPTEKRKAKWTAQTWTKGTLDRYEAMEIGVVGVSFLFDAFTTRHFGTHWSLGCSEAGSLGLIGLHPGPAALLTYDAIKLGIYAIPAMRSPLAYSSAKYMAVPGAYLSYGALRAAQHNIGIGCNR